MAINTIADLDVTPANNVDLLSQSTSGSQSVNKLDNMIRNLAAMLARAYGDIGGTGTVGGSANAITLTSNSTYQALESGLLISFKAGASNTTAVTLNLDSLGAKAVRLPGDVALDDGDIISGGRYLAVYDAAYNAAAGAWVLLNTTTASRFIAGDTASRTLATYTPAIQATFGMAVIRWNASNPGLFSFARSNSGTPGTHTTMADGDALGDLLWEGSDGTAFIRAAKIRAVVDGSPGTNDMPGKLEFQTTSDGSDAPGTRMSINAKGFTRISGGSLGRGAGPVTKTGDFTVGDSENWLIVNKGSSCTVTLPTASDWTSREIMIKTIQAQTVVSASSNVVPRIGGAAGTAILAASDGAWATLVSDGTNWEIMQSS